MTSASGFAANKRSTSALRRSSASICQQHDPRDALGRATMRGVPLGDCRVDMGAHGGMARKVRQRSFAANELVAACGAEPGQHADEFAVLAGHDGVLQRRRSGGERAHSQAADMDPGPGRELEVFGEAPVEHDAACRLRGLGKAHGVARLVEAVLVERRRSEVGPSPVARRHVRAAHAHFELAARWHELELDAGDGHADGAGPLDDEMRGGRQRRGLGRPP